MTNKNVQLTIDFMLNKCDNYFCMKWNQRDEPEEFPYFSNSKIENSNFSYGFSNKLTHIPILLSGNIKIRKKDKLLVELPQTSNPPDYKNINFLKSHLQKCIRLKETSLAIQTAKHLIELDPIQFLRRLSIIFVEDVQITHHYSTLIWLMIAISSNKMTLQLNHIEWLLGLVYIACTCEYKEDYPIPKALDILPNDKIAKQVSLNASALDKNHYAIIQSLIIRSAFGGLTGDAKMLVNAAYVWTQRFQSSDEKWKEYYYTPMRTISSSVLHLEKNDWILSAIDYHCFPKMIDWIMEADDSLSEEDLKYLIWHFSSKINKRTYYDEKEEIVLSNERKEQWEEIKKQVYSIAKYALKKYA